MCMAVSAALMPTPCIDCCLALWHSMLRVGKVQVKDNCFLSCLSLSVTAAPSVFRLACKQYPVVMPSDMI